MKPLPPLDGMDVTELAELLAHHNHRYWDLHAPEISDYDFDKLVNALKAVAPHHPAAAPRPTVPAQPPTPASGPTCALGTTATWSTSPA